MPVSVMENLGCPMRKSLLGAVLLCLPLCAGGQVLQQRPTAAAPEFILGIGDQISVHVADMEDVPAGPLRIGPNGTLDFPMIGQVQASGLTVSQLRQDLVTRLRKYIVSPDVTVNLVESESRPVSVIGEVSNPGVRQLVGPRRLLDVISMAGGLKPDAGPNVLITRQPQWGKLDVGPVTDDPLTHTSSTSVPLDSLMALKAPENNILIEPGDTISVPKADLVYVLGDVKKPGGFELTRHNSISLLNAVTLAEGMGPDDAGSHARILRPASNGDGSMTEIPVNIPKVLAGKDKNIQLFANDIVFVPHSGFKVGSRRAIEAAIGITTGVLVYR